MGNTPSSSPPTDQISPLTKEDLELKMNGFLRLPNTHNTSLVDEHISSIETFASDLQSAVSAIWPHRHESRYAEVHVLLLAWEADNMGVASELESLRNIFADFYHFETETYRIPSEKPGQKTQARIMRFLEYDGPSSLLIVYYAGHAMQSRQGNEAPIWAATNLANSPTLPSGGVQLLFEEADSDVLLLYDCCHAAHPAVTISGHGVTEVIAACGFETETPAVGYHSFTTALVRELAQAYQGPPLSVAMLHSRVLGSLKNWKRELLRDERGEIWRDSRGRVREECHKRRTPVHSFLTNETPHRSIFLSPRPKPPEDSRNSSTLVPSLASGSPSASSMTTQQADSPRTPETSESMEIDQTKSTQVILSVRIDENYFMEGTQTEKIAEWREWVRNIPSAAADVKIQGIYESFSTLVILSIPAEVWDLLPDNPAYSFIGFASSDNKVTEFQASIDNELPVVVEKQPDWPDWRFISEETAKAHLKSTNDMGSSSPSKTVRRKPRKSKYEDLSKITDPDGQRLVRNRMAIRKSRKLIPTPDIFGSLKSSAGNRGMEEKEREVRDAENRAHAGLSYRTMEAHEIIDSSSLSGLPWGSFSMVHVISSGKTRCQEWREGSRALNGRTREGSKSLSEVPELRTGLRSSNISKRSSRSKRQ